MVAAHALDHSVQLVVPRDADTGMIGKRHAYYGQRQVAIDPRIGMLYGLDARMWGDGGAFYDCSFVVSNCIQLRADNAYLIRSTFRTSKATSTAFRAFGVI